MMTFLMFNTKNKKYNCVQLRLSRKLSELNAVHKKTSSSFKYRVLPEDVDRFSIKIEKIFSTFFFYYTILLYTYLSTSKQVFLLITHNERESFLNSMAALLAMLLVLPGDPFFVGFLVGVKGAAIRARATSHTFAMHTLSIKRSCR